MKKRYVTLLGIIGVVIGGLATAWLLSPNLYEASATFAYWPGEIRLDAKGGVVPKGLYMGNYPSGEEVLRQCLAFVESADFPGLVCMRHGRMFPNSAWGCEKIAHAARQARLSVSGVSVPVVGVRIRCEDPKLCAEILAAYLEEVASAAWEQERKWNKSQDRGHVCCPVHVLTNSDRGRWAGKVL